MTKQETAHLVGLINATFPRWNPAPETASAYHLVLQDLDAGMALEAVTDCLKVSEWEPSPAAIREAYQLVRRRREQERRDRTPRLEEPEVTPEQAAENRRVIQAYAEKIGIGGDSGMVGVSPTMEALPVSTALVERPIAARWARRQRDGVVEPATEEEKQDAIRILREGPQGPDAYADPLFVEASRVLDDEGR